MIEAKEQVSNMCFVDIMASSSKGLPHNEVFVSPNQLQVVQVSNIISVSVTTATTFTCTAEQYVKYILLIPKSLLMYTYISDKCTCVYCGYVYNASYYNAASKVMS